MRSEGHRVVGALAGSEVGFRLGNLPLGLHVLLIGGVGRIERSLGAADLAVGGAPLSASTGRLETVLLPLCRP